MSGVGGAAGVSPIEMNRFNQCSIAHLKWQPLLGVGVLDDLRYLGAARPKPIFMG